MSRTISGNANGKKIGSFITYAFSSIAFDIIAYTLSGRLLPVITSHETTLFFFPSIIFTIFNQYLIVYGVAHYTVNAVTFLLISLPIITFVAGIMFHKFLPSRNSKAGA